MQLNTNNGYKKIYNIQAQYNLESNSKQTRIKYNLVKIAKVIYNQNFLVFDDFPA